MADVYFDEKLEEAKKRIPNRENMLGKGLRQPFNNTNSGPRKIMFGVHSDHILPIYNGEKADIETGYEIRFGDYSSSIIKADSDYTVVGKISKFSFAPNHHYYIIVKDIRNKKLDMVERVSYQHITESYGYLNNTTYLDSLSIGSYIPNDTIVAKSLAFDEYNNRKDGVNFNVAYMALDQNMEDSIIISDVAAARLTAPLIKPTSIMINENNIPLNIYGTEDIYKCIPDIGEDIKDNILIALRKEKKEEMVYTESIENLKKIQMSDEKKVLSGKVIDVNIYCNNIENLEAYHNQQFKMYYNEQLRMAQEVVSAVTPFDMEGYEISYDLKKLYAISKRILNHDLWTDKSGTKFSNIYMEIVVLDSLPMKPGDKISNRYGGKGVCSAIVPQKLMPRFNADEYVDVIMNSSTMYGRENPGQIFELHINHVGGEILRYIESGNCNVQESFEWILKFINCIVPEQAEALSDQLENMDLEEMRFFLESFIRDKAIQISTKPISDSFDIDKLAHLYDTFPWVQENDIIVPMKDSNGNYRFIKARRKITVGREHMYRLKQFAEEKFSATSLSATNIREENTKSKAAKNYNELYSNTPIRFGNMEINQLNHLGADVVVETLLLHSRSPHGRRIAERMYTDNPYTVNIRIDDISRNRGAEIVNAYLKPAATRLMFVKIKKHRQKMSIAPIYFDKPTIKEPLIFTKDKNFDNQEYMRIREQQEKEKRKLKLINPLMFYGIDIRRKRKENEESEISARYKKMTPRERATDELRRREEEM